MNKRKPGRRELADDSPFLFLAVGLDEQGSRNLAAAVLYSACLDARRGDTKALAWLEGPEARRWAEALDLDAKLWPPGPQVLAEMSVPGLKPKVGALAGAGD